MAFQIKNIALAVKQIMYFYPQSFKENNAIFKKGR